jgi:hypothetical protein
MAQASTVRVKALKMFKASIDGAAAVMVHPGDVVEVDRFMAGMLMQSQKAEPTEEKVRINKDYTAPPVVASVVSDPFTAFARAIESLTLKIGQLQKGH